MTSEVVIREVRPEDYETVATIAVAAWEPIYAEYRRVLGSEMYDLMHTNWQERKRTETIRSCEQKDGEHVLVSEVAGAVVGFVAFTAEPEKKTGRIESMAVRPDQHGKGIAGKLLKQAMDEMKRMGIRMALVFTGLDPAHAPARRAYEKAGFDIRMEKVVYYKPL